MCMNTRNSNSYSSFAAKNELRSIVQHYSYTQTNLENCKVESIDKDDELKRRVETYMYKTLKLERLRCCRNQL